MVISCIGHDLDHPGFNNAYQINASTDLAIIYNDISPLENHHAAVLFAMLRHSSLDVCRGLTESESREFRRDSVSCILATDMARHGDILNRFKAICDSFKFEDETHRKLVWLYLI